MYSRDIATFIMMVFFSVVTSRAAAEEVSADILFLHTLNEPIQLLPESAVFSTETISVDGRAGGFDFNSSQTTGSLQSMPSIYTRNTENNFYDSVECEGEGCAIPVALMALDFMLTNNQ